MDTTRKKYESRHKSATRTTKKGFKRKVLFIFKKVLASAQKKPPATGSIICIGSSHMQYWNSVNEDLSPLTVHNYGVGGSRMNHAADLFVDHLVIPFKPRAVILNEGSNDIRAGIKPDKILENFRNFHSKLHYALPKTRLYVIGVVPNPNKKIAKDLLKTNDLLSKECAAHQTYMKFIDVTGLIGDDGKTNEKLFKSGDIHMLPTGYAVWKSQIAPVIVPAEKRFE